MVKSSKKQKEANLIFSIKKIKNQKKWTREEDEMLIILAHKFNEKHWKEISKRFAKKNSLQCFSRYKRIRPGIVKGSWKKDEDLKIIDLVLKFGKSWSKISKHLGTRNGKQIRDRFINVLDPEIRKGKFTDDEDKKLVLLFKQYGPRWATIAKYYPNRTADMIKNRFHSSIKKKLTGEDMEKFDFSKDFTENFEKQDTADDSNKSLISLSNQYSSSVLGYTKSIMDSDSIIQDMDMLEQKNYNSKMETDFYTAQPINNNFTTQYTNNFAFNFNDILNVDREVKAEDTFNLLPALWNFKIISQSKRLFTHVDTCI
jgi:hypothetical protein